MIYDQYFDDVYRYVLLKVGNKWDTDDIVSDIFRKVFEKIHTTREIENVKAWLMIIARHTVIDHYRKRREVTLGDDVERYTYPVLFEDRLEKVDDLVCLKKSIQRLEKEELEIMNLHYFCEMKYKEIGDVLGKTESAIKMKSSRLIKKITIFVRQCLEESENG